MSYEYNVNNAFLSAGNYAARVNSIKATNNSEIVVMAHSLGCMPASAAIADHGMQAGKFFALNGAVPAEAYDASMANIKTNELNRLLHEYWRGYKSNTWSANYHQLFTNSVAFPDDDRASLAWRGRFADAAPVLYNFWSSGDEVLEISEKDINLTSGIEFDWEWPIIPLTINPRRYTWHKQALFKGRSSLYGTTWAGWEFWEWLIGGKVYTEEEANSLTDDELRSAPVFRHNPDLMFTNVISQANINNLLARGIPELSFPIGYTNVLEISENPLNDRNFNINVGDFRRDDKAWPQRNIDFNTPENTRPKRWLHTDLMNVAYHYTHKLYKKIVEKGSI